jgi:hypothetical protein
MALDFSGTDVADIEAALEAQRPGGWRRLNAAILEQYSNIDPRAGWRVAVPAGQFLCDKVDHLHLLIDSAFPASDPRVVAPQLGVGDWPHVEPRGLLCLVRRTWSVTADVRAISALGDAAAVLQLNDEDRRREFSREFVAYWIQMLSQNPNGPLFLSLVDPSGASREIYFARPSRERVVLADTRDGLLRWLANSGESIEELGVRRTRLIWLPQPWLPSQFPRRVSDVFAAAGSGTLNEYLRSGESLPVLFGATTETGPVFVGADLPTVPRSRFKKGFRSPDKVPGGTLAQFSATNRALRCRVERADARWVHGRDNNPQQSTLVVKRVGVVGCGSLGASVARLLAQMGVGSFVLVDSDDLSTANTSRHVLGSTFVRRNKATALGEFLLRDLPHLEDVCSYPCRFEKLSDRQLDSLTSCDVVISAGIDWAGDVALDRWRRTLPRPPVHVCGWTEEFALVGHAVGLFGHEALLPGFSADGEPIFSLTTWSSEVRTVVTEAGCGNLFQPHGAIELSNSVILVAELALDVLSGRLNSSCRRVWLGDLDDLRRLGGTPASAFDVSRARREYPWRAVPS